MVWAVLAGASALLWTVLLLLPWRPWSTREFLDAAVDKPAADLHELTVLIPARNEAEHIQQTLHALSIQGEGLQIIVIDDQSTDATAEQARRGNLPHLQVLQGEPLPPGWSGKLWALQQGLAQVRSQRVLLLDADIQLEAGVLRALLEKMASERLDFISLMVQLRMQGFWERLLLPAFVFFFKLVYPFRLSNDPRMRRFAAAAGGCILLDKHVLDDIGGFTPLRDALIDDCTLARNVKTKGYRTWVGLTRSAHSLRPYPHLSDIWDMVARTAYTQLHYSPLLLLGVTFLMFLTFWIPIAGLALAGSPAKILAVAALAAMMLSYLQTLHFYRQSPLWAVLLPVIGGLFLAMTWSSAWRYWHGRRSAWKGRVYHRHLGVPDEHDTTRKTRQNSG